MGEKVSRYREISRRYGDPWIWGIYLTLVVFSIVESYSASSRDVALMGVYEPYYQAGYVSCHVELCLSLD